MSTETRFVGKKLTVDEFLDHRERLLPDAVYELHDGIIAMKRPPQALQGQMTAQLAAALIARYRAPYRVYVGSGVVGPHDKHSCLFPDLCVSREPLQELWLTGPTIIVEVLPICRDKPDLYDRLMLYTEMHSVRHVLVARPQKRSIDLHTREDGNWNSRTYVNDASLMLEGAGWPLPLDEIYHPLGL